MGRFLVVTWDGAGNLLSTLGIAQRLAQRGHEVRLLGHRSIQRRYGERGWRFLAFNHTADFDSAVATDVGAELQRLGDQLWFSSSVARDAAAELEREPADVLVADCLLLGALSAGQAAGIPTAALFHTAVAPFRSGPMLEMMAPAIPTITAMRAELGLSAVESMADVHDACALSIVAMPKEFEPEVPLPPNAVYVGPILDGPELVGTDRVDVADGPEPLVVISLSTSYQAQAPLLQRLVEACAELPIRVVATTGPAVDPASIEAPANAQVVQFVAHDDLLPHASLVITHAGLGTVMTALSHGVPLLCVPMGRDQFFNAGRVTQLGAGRVLAFDADAESIRSAVLGLLDDSGSRDGAKRMANVIAGYAGATTAVSELERLSRTATEPMSDIGPRGRQPEVEPRVLRCDDRGNGDAVVLVPGGLTGWLTWIPHQERLAGRYRVIRVQPIHNELGSGGRPGRPGYTAEVEREALRMTLDHLGVDRAHLVGWSGGGKAALEFATQYPERVQTLTLVEPAAYWVLEQLGEPEPVEEVNAFIHSLFGREVTEDELAAFLVYAGFLASGDSARTHPNWQRWVRHRMTLSWQSEELDHPPRSVDDLGGVCCSTLLVKGTLTADWLKRVVDVLGGHLPNATVVELEGDHACHIQSMDTFLRALERHVRQESDSA